MSYTSPYVIFDISNGDETLIIQNFDSLSHFHSEIGVLNSSTSNRSSDLLGTTLLTPVSPTPKCVLTSSDLSYEESLPPLKFTLL